MAEPFSEAGKWYSAFKDRRGRRYLVLKATTTTEARRQNAELEFARTGFGRA